VDSAVDPHLVRLPGLRRRGRGGGGAFAPAARASGGGGGGGGDSRLRARGGEVRLPRGGQACGGGDGGAQRGGQGGCSALRATALLADAAAGADQRCLVCASSSGAAHGSRYTRLAERRLRPAAEQKSATSCIASAETEAYVGRARQAEYGFVRTRASGAGCRCGGSRGGGIDR
jgi:hypothetical protein